MQSNIQTLRAAGQKRLSGLRVKLALLKQEVKGPVQREDVQLQYVFIYSASIKTSKEVYFTSGLSFGVYLQGYLTYLMVKPSRLTLVSFFLNLVWLVSSHHSSCVTNSC